MISKRRERLMDSGFKLIDGMGLDDMGTSKTFAEIMALQPELLGNPNFDDASVWTLDANWSIAGGVLVAATAAALSIATQSFTLVTGKTYFVKYDVTERTAGAVQAQALGSGASSGATHTSAGSYRFSFVADRTSYSFRFRATGGGFSGKMDNASLKMVPDAYISQIPP